MRFPRAVHLLLRRSTYGVCVLRTTVGPRLMCLRAMSTTASAGTRTAVSSAATRTAAAAASINTSTTLVSSFAGAHAWIKRWLLLVHPDVMQRHGRRVADVNAVAVRQVIAIAEFLRAQSRIAEGGTSAGSAAPPQAALDSCDVRFHVQLPGASSLVPRSVRYNSDSSLPGRVSALVARGLTDSARAHVLHACVRFTNDLLAAAGVQDADAAPVELQLHERYASIMERVQATRDAAQDAGRDDRPDTHAHAHTHTHARRSDTADAMRAHLLAHSPLLQGKTEIPRSLNLSGASLFSREHRRRRATQVIARVCALYEGEGEAGRGADASGVSREEMRDAMNRLRRCMETHHDAMHLYHDVWLGMHLRIGVHFFADAHTRTLIVPVDFQDAELVHFCHIHLPRIIAVAIPAAKAVLRQRRAS